MKWEVRTMRSAISCSKTLIGSDWRRFWPVAALYGICSFFLLPMAVQNAENVAAVVYSQIHVFVVLSFFLGLLLAMAVYSYLTDGRAVGLMHALPVSRDRQFFSHFAAALSMLTAVNLLTFLLTLLAQAVTGGWTIEAPLMWLAVTELSGFFFLAFATLAATVTGWLPAVPVIYVGWNFMVMAYAEILRGMKASLLDGYVAGISEAEEWLTPPVKLGNDTYGNWTNGVYVPNADALPTALVYAVVGAAMLVLAWRLYRRRDSETAGAAIAFRPLRPVARYVISLAAGLGMGTMVHEIFGSGGGDVASLILWQLVMGGLVYCAVEMLLRKSFQIFDRRTAAGLLALWLVLAGVCLAVKLDVFGIEKRVPQADQVESVEINFDVYSGRAESRDEVTIQAVVDLHRVLVNREYTMTSDGYGETGQGLYISYRLKSGATLNRQYVIDTSDPDVRRALETLVNRPEIRRSQMMEDYGQYGEAFIVGYADPKWTGEEKQLTPLQCLTLYRALGADMERSVPLERVEYAYVDIRLETTEGSYTIWRVRRDCVNTLAAMQEIGLIESENDLDWNEW